MVVLVDGQQVCLDKHGNKTIINAALHGWEYEIKAGVPMATTHLVYIV